VNVSWFFKTCAHIERGIQADMIRTTKDIEREKREYKVYADLASSQKRFSEFEEKIARMESDLRLFPMQVISTMCMDMAALIDKGDHGALKLMRAAGVRGVSGDLMTKYLKRWKRTLYKRAVWEYLVQRDEETRWPSLLLGMSHARMWLSQRMRYVIGDSRIKMDMADFIVEVLFPKKRINKQFRLLRLGMGHGTPESANENLEPV
jgi:hypothetical protein